MSQKYFQIFRSKISDLRTENVDYLKKPPWKIFFFDIFAIHSSSRYEKRCQMLQRLFSLFQGSKNQLCMVYVTCRFSLIVTQSSDEISVQMHSLIKCQKCKITGPQLIWSHWSVIRYKHVSNHTGDWTEPTRMRLIWQCNFVTLVVAG